MSPALVRLDLAFSRRRYLSTSTIASRLGVSTRSVRLWAECGEIPAMKVGRQWRFDEAGFEQWLQGRYRGITFKEIAEITATSLGRFRA